MYLSKKLSLKTAMNFKESHKTSKKSAFPQASFSHSDSKSKIKWPHFLSYCKINSVKEIFSIDLYLYLKDQSSQWAIEKSMLIYLSKIFPSEFLTYFETLEFHQFCPKKSNPNTDYKPEQATTSFVRIISKLKTNELLQKRIAKKKQIRSKIHKNRLKNFDNEEIIFLEGCKETKLFKQNSVVKIVAFIEQITNLNFKIMRSSIRILRFLNYLLTVSIKLTYQKLFRKISFWWRLWNTKWLWQGKSRSISSIKNSTTTKIDQKLFLFSKWCKVKSNLIKHL